MDSKKAMIIFREKVFNRLKEELEKLAQYIVHPTFFTEKIRYNQDTGSIIYKSRMHLGKKRNFEVLDAVEFLHRVCLHIPDAYESLIRYYGYYSNAARGKRKKLGLETESDISINQEITLIDDLLAKKTCRKSWRQLIYKINEADPLKCPQCGFEMKIIAFIQDYQEIKKILKYLEMWPIQYPQPPPEKSKLYTHMLSKLSASKHFHPVE